MGQEGRPVWNPDVRGTFAANTAPFRGRVKLRPTAALAAMRAARKELGAYDVVYIDARSSRHALETAVLAFPLLAPGGVLVLTNYTHSKERDARCPRRGIDGFVDAYSGDLRVLRNGFHTFLERRVKPLPSPPCFSEYFDEPTTTGASRCRRPIGGRGSREGPAARAKKRT